MAGPNLEVFKFGLYMFFPVWIMFKFGDPQWYQDYVQPYKEVLFPPYESTHRPPKTQPELKEELAKLKEARALRRAQARAQEGSPDSQSTPSPLSSLSTNVSSSQSESDPVGQAGSSSRLTWNIGRSSTSGSNQETSSERLV